jgi:DnaK suppressor protein
MTPAAREAAARLLAAKRAEIQAQLAAVRAESDRSTASAAGLGFGKRVGDTTSVAVERLTEVAAHGGLLGTLRQLDRAEQHLADGTYGRCESCGQAIPDERLDARPFATLCVGCA